MMPRLDDDGSFHIPNQAPPEFSINPQGDKLLKALEKQRAALEDMTASLDRLNALISVMLAAFEPRL